MIRFSSIHLYDSEMAFLRRYAFWVLHQFVKPSVMNKTSINIRIILLKELTDKEDRKVLHKYRAWSTYDGIENNIKKFSIVLNANDYNRSGKKSWIRLKDLLMNLGHELVHTKQYLNNEMFDYVSGDIRYKGNIFAEDNDDTTYYNSPWEIEAHGRELGLYKMYVNKLKDDAKKRRIKH